MPYAATLMRTIVGDEGGRDFVVFGPCPESEGVPAGVPQSLFEELLATPPPAELRPPSAGGTARLSE